MKIRSALLLCTLILLSGCGGSGGDTTNPFSGNTGGNSNETTGAPVLSAVNNKSVLAGSTLSFTVSATDPDGDDITYTADGTVGPNANPFATNPPAVFDMSGRSFSWTPQSAQAGNYSVRFTATDNSTDALSDSETITITVQDQIAYGASLYADYCESCHGPSGRNGSATLVAGAVEADITFAIDNVGAMSGLSSLSTSDVQAIAAYLQSVP
jgi:mono/diheme cytochrome c family protein